jgi:hypothetical protein
MNKPASSEDIDRICRKLAKLWKLCSDKTLGEVLHEPTHEGVLGRFYGAWRTDRWPGRMTNEQFEQCVDATLKDKEAGIG